MTAGERILGGQETGPEDDELAAIAAQDGGAVPAEDLSDILDTSEEADPEAIDASQSIRPELYKGIIDTFLRHYKEFGHLVLKITGDQANAEDIVAEIIAESLGGLAHSSIRDPEKVAAYMRQSVINRARSALRHRRVVEEKAAQLLQGDKGDSTADEALQSMENEVVWAALRGLPTRQRQVFILRYFYDMSESQIANALGISRGSVKSHTSRGMANLKELLQAQGISFTRPRAP